MIVEGEIARLAELALGPPGVRRPQAGDAVRLFAPSQSKAHRDWVPPGFEALTGLSDPSTHLENARNVRFPLDGVEPRLEDDLDAAISKLCEIGPAAAGVAEFRRERMDLLSESAVRLYGQSTWRGREVTAPTSRSCTLWARPCNGRIPSSWETSSCAECRSLE